MHRIKCVSESRRGDRRLVACRAYGTIQRYRPRWRIRREPTDRPIATSPNPRNTLTIRGILTTQRRARPRARRLPFATGSDIGGVAERIGFVTDLIPGAAGATTDPDPEGQPRRRVEDHQGSGDRRGPQLAGH